MCLLGSCKINVVVLNAMINIYAKYKINPYSMSESYCIILGMNHYTYIISLIGHATYPKPGALNFIYKIPIKLTHVSTWCL